MKLKWTMGDGTKILFSKMTVEHLRNAKNLKEKFTRTTISKNLYAGYSLASYYQGEMALDCLEMELKVGEDALDDIESFLYEHDDTYQALCYWLYKRTSGKEGIFFVEE